MSPAVDAGLVWSIILIVGAGTILIRLSFILLFGWIDDVPPTVELVLQHIPMAVLAGLIVPAVIYLDGTVTISLGNDRLLAASVAAVVAWRTESMIATLGVGMGALWLLAVAPW